MLGIMDDPFNPTFRFKFRSSKAVYYTYVNAYYTNNNFTTDFIKYLLKILCKWIQSL